MRRSQIIKELFIVFLPAMVIMATAGSLIDKNPLLLQCVIWVAYVVMLSIVYFQLRRQGNGWAQLGVKFGLPGWRRCLILILQATLVFICAAVAFGLGASLMAKLLGSPEPADFESYNYLQGNLGLLLISLAGVYVVSSFGEEVLFRGYLMTRTAELFGGSKLGWWSAVLVSTLVFGLIHYDWGIAGIVQTGFMGFVLTLSYLLLKRNLWANIIAHGILDTLLLTQLYLA